MGRTRTTPTRMPSSRSLYRPREAIAGRRTIRPALQPGVMPPWGPLGSASHYRLRYYFAPLEPWRTVAFMGLGALSPDAMDAVSGVPDLGHRSSDRWIGPMLDFFTSLRELNRLLTSPGARLPRDAEDTLNRHCYVLALLEALFRVGPELNSPLYLLGDAPTIDDLWSLGNPWLNDLRNLSWGFWGEGTTPTSVDSRG